MNPALAIRSIRRELFSDCTDFQVSGQPMSFDFVPIETSSPVSVSSTCTATSSINTLSASFIANGLQLELHAIKNASQKKSDLLVKKKQKSPSQTFNRKKQKSSKVM
jgi:hypothetical protein